MEYLQDKYLIFDKNITLNKTYKDKIRTGRDTLRNKLNGCFIDAGYNSPKHMTQGSYAMYTALLPTDNEDFDLDNGVYLQGYSINQSDWPDVNKVHEQIKNYLNGHTHNIIDKSTCVRIEYKDNYHIDLPIYIMGVDDKQDDVAYLAHKESGWIISDPQAFRDWFNSHVQASNDRVIRRIVKYIKKWARNKDVNLSGMAISILVAESYEYKNIESDSTVLLDVLTVIHDRLSMSFSCKKPIRPMEEDLLSDYSFKEQMEILESLEQFKDSVYESIYMSDNENASCDILVKTFGDCFPKGELKIQNPNVYEKSDEPERIGQKNRHYA